MFTHIHTPSTHIQAYSLYTHRYLVRRDLPEIKQCLVKAHCTNKGGAQGGIWLTDPQLSNLGGCVRQIWIVYGGFINTSNSFPSKLQGNKRILVIHNILCHYLIINSCTCHQCMYYAIKDLP